MGTPLRVLIVEDSVDDAALLLGELRRGGFTVTSERVENAGTMIEALDRGKWDMVIAGYTMRRFSGEEALRLLRARTAEVPFIFVSGTIGEEAAVAALKFGANDYLVKGNLQRLVPAINRELREAETLRERRAAEGALRESEARYRLLFKSNPGPMWVYDLETLAFLAVNDAALLAYGYSDAEFLGMTIKNIRPPEDVGPLLKEMAEQIAEFSPLRAWRHRRKDDTIIDVEISAHAIEWSGRRARLVLATDVTERKKLEGQLIQSQKMEAIGRLAGGIAHDFNNLLNVILGYGETILEALPAQDPIREDVRQMVVAGERAAGLTSQLLAFSRKQIVEPKILDLNALVKDIDTMIQRIIGEEVELVTVPSADAAAIKTDPGQVEQVIMNLALNARDAMPHGGRLMIETGNAWLGEDYARAHPGVRPGPYVMLAVSDTGVGMPPEVQSQIFEPFFTTKEVGKGTGLGLATVYAIVKRAGGNIWVYSEPEHGTTFKVYFPQVEGSAKHIDRRQTEAAPRGNETILVVEDEPAVRELVHRILESSGYAVLVAASVREGFELSARHDGPVHLLLTDVVMPGGSGKDLARRLAPIRPTLRVLYMSGYTDSEIVRHGVLDPGVAFIQKPFTPRALAHQVREVLDSMRPAES